MITLRDYQQTIVDNVRAEFKRGVKAVCAVAPTGCLTGDTKITINRAGCSRKITIKRAYTSHNGLDRYRWDPAIQTKIRAFTGERIGLHDVDDIVYSGKKEVHRVTLEDGKSIKATKCHKFLTLKGWKRVDELQTTDSIMKEDSSRPQRGSRKKKKPWDCHVGRMTHHPYAIELNSKKWKTKRVEKHRAIYEARINGLELQEFREIVSSYEDRAALLKYVDPSKYDIHHLDGDHYNNEPTNLAKLTKLDHLYLHAKEGKKNFNQGVPDYSRVAKIESLGVEDTYDICCKHPHHNFVANGMVAHNSGKSIILASICQHSQQKGTKVLICVHRKELVEQLSETLGEFDVDHGVICSGYESISANVQVASVQTLVRRFEKIEQPTLVITDECHHLLAGNTWGKVIEAFPEAHLLGLTATPERLDGRGLGKQSAGFFESIALGPEVSELIERGYLANYRLFAPPVELNLSEVKIRRGDYDAKDLNREMNRAKITGDAVGHYKRICPTAKGIVFCVSVEHSKSVAKEYCDNGINAAHLDGTTPKNIRRQILKDYRDDKIQILTNVALFTEGFDVKKIETVQILRPTKSLGLWKQAVGRALRPAPGKTHAIILDHVGGTQEHGLPDTPYEWSLEGREKKKPGELNLFIKTCPDCFTVHQNKKECPSCGYEYEVELQRSGSDFSEEELVEITSEKIEQLKAKQRREVGRARTLQELQVIGKQRGYKAGWAYRIYSMRKKQGRAS